MDMLRNPDVVELLDRFDRLPTHAAWKERKEIADRLEAIIEKDQEATLPTSGLHDLLAGNGDAGRILVYLLAQHRPALLSLQKLEGRSEREWDKLNRAELDPELSRMPLYYAMRALLERLKVSPRQEPYAANIALFRQIEEGLLTSLYLGDRINDHGQPSRVLSKVRQILEYLRAERVLPPPETPKPPPLPPFWEFYNKVVLGTLAVIVAMAAAYTGYRNFQLQSSREPTEAPADGNPSAAEASTARTDSPGAQE